MERPKVYVTRRLPEEALGRLPQVCRVAMWEQEEVPVPDEVLDREIGDAEGVLTLLTERWDEPRLRRAPRLRILSTMSVGYDHIDVPACTARGILVTHTPEVLTETTADLAWALMLAAARRIVEADRLVRSGGWHTWSPFFMAGVDVHGAVLGILGLGRIGRAVARRAQGFRMKVLYWSRRRYPEAEAELGVEHRSLEELLREADFVVITLPLTPETRGLIGPRELALMKPTAVLVNVARGGIVDEAALARALEEGRLGAAGLDVWEREPVPPDHPLLRQERVVALPHIGSASVATRMRMAQLAAENLVAAFTGGKPPTPVNPEAWPHVYGSSTPAAPR